MTNQPKWKLVAQLGDVHPIDYGGYFVYEDETGVYAPEVEFLVAPDDDSGEWTAYRFSLEPCTFINGVLSDNKFHPDKPAWFADKIGKVAECSGQPDIDAFISSLTGDNIEDKAWAWRAIGEYHGFENLDNYPLTLKTRKDVEAHLFTRNSA